MHDGFFSSFDMGFVAKKKTSYKLFLVLLKSLLFCHRFCCCRCCCCCWGGGWGGCCCCHQKCFFLKNSSTRRSSEQSSHWQRRFRRTPANFSSIDILDDFDVCDVCDVLMIFSVSEKLILIRLSNEPHPMRQILINLFCSILFSLWPKTKKMKLKK